MVIKTSKKFRKQYLKSGSKIKSLLDERLLIFVKNPKEKVLNDHALTGKLTGFRSINITGDWRAIYIESDGVITFVLFGTHSQLYG